MYDNCGEIENFSTCGEICLQTDVENSEILHIWHVCDVENVTIYAKCMQYMPVIHAVLSRNFMWREIEPKSTFVEKK